VTATLDVDPLGHAAVSPAPPVLAVEGLHVTFPGGVQALRGVTLHVRPSEILGLVGESGSGKSVLGLASLGLLPPAAHVTGRAVLEGEDMVAADDEARRLVRKHSAGAVFQDPMTSLNPTMKVGRQVAEAAGSMAGALDALDRARVPDAKRRAEQFPHELSGGLRQRVMIAMAIAGSPALVLADEPTTALDVTVQAEILDLLAELRDETGSSILFVTHDLAVAARIADRIAVLYGGRLAEIGPAADVLRQPSHPYSTALMAARLRPDSERGVPLPNLDGEPPDPRHHPPGCAFAPRCPLAVEPCDAAPPDLSPAPTHAGDAACLRAGQGADVRLRVREHAALTGGADRPKPKPTSDIALQLDDVTKSFGRRKRRHVAVDGLSLTVPRGGAVALVGESGCGKTTTLRMAVGLETPDSGDVYVGPGGPPQLVFQDAGSSLTPWMTVGDLLDERLRAEGVSGAERTARAAEVLGLVGLSKDVAQAKPRQLSGGQRQRVCLARAAVVPPTLLACDEPISALDVSLAATVLNLLGRLRAELGMAILFVTHDLAAARYVGDHVAVMADGRIVEEGPSEVVFAQPHHPQTAALVAAVPGFEVA
jgi:peptide/nickel transport system ATP-binding protein